MFLGRALNINSLLIQSYGQEYEYCFKQVSVLNNMLHLYVTDHRWFYFEVKTVFVWLFITIHMFCESDVTQSLLCV